jgi:hypothetical protein
MRGVRFARQPVSIRIQKYGGRLEKTSAFWWSTNAAKQALEENKGHNSKEQFGA